MNWFGFKASKPESTTQDDGYVDIENGVLPVLAPSEIKAAQEAQREQLQQQHQQEYENRQLEESNDDAVRNYFPAPMMPVATPVDQHSCSEFGASDHRRIIETTLPNSHPVIICEHRATAPPQFLDDSTPPFSSVHHDSTRNNGLQQHQQPSLIRLQKQQQNHVRVYTRYPMKLNPCPFCGMNQCRTNVITSPHWITWILVIGLAFLFWPLCWLPLVMDNCKRTKHYCSNCAAEIDDIYPMQDCCIQYRT